MTATLTPPPVAPPAPTTPPVPAGPPVLPPMSEDLREFRAGLVRFTGADLRKMWEAEILYEDSSIELLDGILVYRDCGSGFGDNGKGERGPTVPGMEHDYAVRMLGRADRRIDSADCHLVTQLTLILSEEYEPIPDAMILRGDPAAYRARQPTPADVICLIEVADHSYRRDAGPKRTAYAAAGVGQYVIIDLHRRLAEVYADPDRATGSYPLPVIVSAEGAIALRIGDGQMFSLKLVELLP